MRIILPGVRTRRQIDRGLQDFFREHREREFLSAIRNLSRFYRLPSPKVAWFEYLDWGKSGGRCYEDGRIHLVHPEAWKRGRKYNSERQWIQTVYHEMGHYVLWADPETKADFFADRFAEGVRTRTRRSPRPAAPRDTHGARLVAGERRRKGPKRAEAPRHLPRRAARR